MDEIERKKSKLQEFLENFKKRLFDTMIELIREKKIGNSHLKL